MTDYYLHNTRLNLHLEIGPDGRLFIDFQGRADVLTAALTLVAERDPVFSLGVQEAANWINEKKGENPPIFN